MAKLTHLPLPRTEGQFDRKKRKSFPKDLARDVPAHAARLIAQIDAIKANGGNLPADEVHGPLVVQVRSLGTIDPKEWPRVDMQILASDARNSVVLFASDNELVKFRARLDSYQGPKPPNQKTAQYSGFLDPIEEITQRVAVDRIGPGLKASGITAPEQIDPDQTYVLDVELYRPLDEQVGLFADRIERLIDGYGGKVLSRYNGASLLLMRFEGPGTAVRRLLQAAEVFELDFPPSPDDEPIDISEIDVGADIVVDAAEEDAAVIGIIDSGITSEHPYIAGSVAGAFGIPAALGDADENGHGTSIAGVAAFGDLRPMLQNKRVAARFRIASARVLNSKGKFDDVETVPEQMDKAIRRLHDHYGCRVINISLGDPTRPAGKKPSAWAATLDALARELDLVIIVSSGNRRDLFGVYGEGIVDGYPDYLLDDQNRILEPATAANVVTVSSIARASGRRANDDVSVRIITEVDHPSPFSRGGPGVAGIQKPDFVDYGGTVLFDGAVQQIIRANDRPEAGIVCLYSKYLDRLLTARSGTSLAAPLVAYKAAAIRVAFPSASANLVRALLSLSAEIPQAAIARLTGMASEDLARVMGYGLPYLDHALSSDDNRVILYDEGEIDADHFMIYALPIPKEFQSGKRKIDVALAFDPPTRHSRFDYLGHKMSFEMFRGRTLRDIYDDCRKLLTNEEAPPRIDGKYKCQLEPKITRRGPSTLQRATYVAQQNTSKYGDTYHLVIRCEKAWSNTSTQKFAVAVEMSHSEDIRLHMRLTERIRVRV